MPGKGRPFEDGNKARLGKTLPRLTCVNCGVEKVATRFPKKGGETYKDLPAADPRKYDRQCKLCKKPRKPGQKREEVTEPTVVQRPKKKKKRRRRETPAEGKIRRREETRVQSMLYLASKGCEECGERDPRKLEYDHKDPDDKDRNISRLILDGYTWTSPVLADEVAKCRILCANCHRKHTVQQQGYYAEDRVQETLGKLARRYKFTL